MAKKRKALDITDAPILEERRIKVLGNEYTVFVVEYSDDLIQIGMSDPVARTIYATQTPKFINTLIHEMMHCAMFDSGIRTLLPEEHPRQLEEPIVSTLATMMSSWIEELNKPKKRSKRRKK